MTAAHDDAYYATERQEIVPLVAWPVDRVLEIGCGTGATLAFLKRTGRCRWAGGVELAPGPAAVAAGRLDWFRAQDAGAGDLPLEPASIDVVLALDVLEHLVDPWSAVRGLSRLVKPGGALIASVPNVRYYRVAADLLFRGRWNYADHGILDRTHLRFFVRDSACALVEAGGLKVDRVQALDYLKPWTGKWLLNRLAGGRLDDLHAKQYLIRAVRPA